MLVIVLGSDIKWLNHTCTTVEFRYSAHTPKGCTSAETACE